VDGENVKYFPNMFLGYFTQLLNWVNRIKANQPLFGYALADLPGNVKWAIRLCANDVEVTLAISLLIDDILTRTYLKIGDWIIGTGAARRRTGRTGASSGKNSASALISGQTSSRRGAGPT
jgi:hypothetical protein